MTYIHIPVDFQNPTDQDFEQFCTAMDDLKDVPVHVHCIANYRVSAFFYRYRRNVLDMDEAEGGEGRVALTLEGYDLLDVTEGALLEEARERKARSERELSAT